MSISFNVTLRCKTEVQSLIVVDPIQFQDAMKNNELFCHPDSENTVPFLIDQLLPGPDRINTFSKSVLGSQSNLPINKTYLLTINKLPASSSLGFVYKCNDSLFYNRVDFNTLSNSQLDLTFDGEKLEINKRAPC